MNKFINLSLLLIILYFFVPYTLISKDLHFAGFSFMKCRPEFLDIQLQIRCLRKITQYLKSR